jgi:peptidoglycan/xylan/chitin deacetylase (PgdA/CDA1 family)
MRPKRNPVPRARDSWVWLGGLALLGILGGGVTAAAIVLWENIDIRQLVPQLAAPPLPIPVPEPPPEAAREEVAYEAVVFSSPRNQGYFPDPTYYRATLQVWSELVDRTGGNVREVADAEGLRGLRPQDLLVLVEAPCLATEEVAAVRAHLRAGGGVVSNWAVGVRDADCEWTGWQTIMELTGAEDVRELPPREGLYLTVPGGVALSPGFDPGTRIELRPDPSLALRLSGPRVYWSDWALNPQADESGGGADVAAIATHSALGGRIAWFGLRVGQAATSADSVRLSRLVENGIAWAASVPTAAPAPWPDARRAALVFTLDVEDEPQNALQMAAFLGERGLPGTFFVVSRLVLEDRAMAQALIAAGEVGSQTSDHTPLQGLTAQEQRLRLGRSWTEIENWTGVPPTGLRPPEETFDPNTLDAWQRAGGTYLLATNESRSASPEVHRVGGGVQILLPRLLKDDYNIIVQDRVLRGASLGEALLAGTRKMRAIGGLAVVAGHTQIIREGPRIDALRTVADSALAQGDWWIARASDVAAWWAARAGTTVDFEPATNDTGESQSPVSDVVVTAPFDRGVDDLWIDIVLPSVPEAMIPLVAGRSVDFERTEWGMRIPVGSLAAGDERRITFLVLEDEDGDAAPAG